MCFIKNSCLGSPALLGDNPFLPDLISTFPTPKEPIPSCSSIDLCPSFSSIPHFLTTEPQLLQSLLSAVHFNSNLLLKLQQVHPHPHRTSTSPSKWSSKPPKRRRCRFCKKKEVSTVWKEGHGPPKSRWFKNCLEKNSINTD